MKQQAVKPVPTAKLGQKEQSFDCKSGNVNQSLSMARWLLVGTCPAWQGMVGDCTSCCSWEPDWWPSRSLLLFLPFPVPWGHFISYYHSFLKKNKSKQNKQTKNSKGKRRSEIKAVALLISNLKSKWWERWKPLPNKQSPVDFTDGFYYLYPVSDWHR